MGIGPVTVTLPPPADKEFDPSDVFVWVSYALAVFMFVGAAWALIPGLPWK